VVRASNAAAGTEVKQSMLQTVHRWFDSLHLPDHPLEDLVHRDAHLIDNTNQACYAGYKAMKHRMQSVHEVLPKLVEAADVADTAHHAVAAHWVAKPSGKGETAAGTYVFKFDDNGMIIEITSYPDAPEDEYLDA
jgi:hypothetical protein